MNSIIQNKIIEIQSILERVSSRRKYWKILLELTKLQDEKIIPIIESFLILWIKNSKTKKEQTILQKWLDKIEEIHNLEQQQHANDEKEAENILLSI
jgi:allophanate hydrolase subunit 1